METDEAELTFEDLVRILCEGDVDGELQERVARVIRTDPRFTEQITQLEAMAAAARADDLWDGLERHLEVDRLLAAESWEDPATILNPEKDHLYELSYRKLLAVADARLATANDPVAVEVLKARLQKAESKVAANTVFQITEALGNLSVATAEKVIDKVRRKYSKKETSDGK